MKPSILQVALPGPLPKLFDYACPADWPCAIGSRVEVPFGKRGVRIGVVVGHRTQTDVPLHKLKEIQARIDEEPLFNEVTLALARFAADYYHHNVGDVLHQMMPVALRKGHPVQDCKKPWASLSISANPPTFLPNEEQQAAIAAIAAHQNAFHVTLLQGVTGSGKTEVYLRVIEPLLKAGKQVLILVPEIGLTPQTVARFEQRFGLKAALLHSGLSDKTRTAAWLAARAGEAQIVIATRSGIFTPLPNLALIVVDEEHDASFKQQEGFRYHARDLAIWRAKHSQIPVILGSATPSLETLRNAQAQRYTTVHLHARASGNINPIRLIDMRKQTLQAGISEALLLAIGECLDRGEQTMLFLNRRGYAPTWLCHECGEAAQCPRCDARLTLHYPKRLVCHHCSFQTSKTDVCAVCGGTQSVLLGEGTQRVEAFLQDYFPQARLARIDRDSMRKKNAFEKMMQDVHAGEVDILLGTQMLAKGHDFPKVTLVAILEADAGLFSSDFRAAERLAQLLTQVAGRAGRAQWPGEVWIQTHHPDHPFFKAWLEGGYPAFADLALRERETFILPPYGHLGLLRAESLQPQRALDFLTEVKNWFAKKATLAVLGPVPSAMEKRQGKFRAQLLMQARSRAQLHDGLTTLMQALHEQISTDKIQWSLDVDPQEML